MRIHGFYCIVAPVKSGHWGGGYFVKPGYGGGSIVKPGNGETSLLNFVKPGNGETSKPLY
jgi:hypothetical protein